MLLPLVSCSTTRVLGEGECRLAKNKVRVTNDKNFNVTQLTPYLRQIPNSSGILGWNPFLYIYNWSDGSGSGWDKFTQKLGEKPVVFDNDLVRESEKNVISHLEYIGYFGSGVKSEVVRKGRKINVIYDATLGHRIPIDSIVYKIPENPEFREAFQTARQSGLLGKGDYLSELSLEQEREQISSHLRNSGFYGINKSLFFFEADTVSVPGKAILYYGLKDFPACRYTIGDVIISHSETLPFRASVLKDLNLIKPGKTYSEKTVSDTYYRLAKLKTFTSVGIEMTESGDSTVDCRINLREAKTRGVKINLEASTNSSGLIGISPKISFYNRNLFHGGEWFNISFDGNFQFKFNDNTRANELGVSANLSLPKFVGLPYKAFKGANIPRTEFKLSYSYQNRPEYTRNMASGAFGYSGSDTKNRFIYQIYPVQLNIVKMSAIDPKFQATLDKNPFLKYSYQDHFDAGASIQLLRTTNPDVIPKYSYNFQRLSLDVSGNVISLFNNLMKQNSDGARLLFGAPYAQYVRGEFSFGGALVFGKNDSQMLAARLLAGAGYAYGNSTVLPYEKQFYCGGASSMRGWQARSLGPGAEPLNTSFIIPSQTGNYKIEADVEYRMKLFWKLEGAVFAEVGNVFINLDNFYKDLAADWGIGLRLNLNLILLRLDMGMKVHDPAMPEGERWRGPQNWFKYNGCSIHFGVGYPF